MSTDSDSDSGSEERPSLVETENSTTFKGPKPGAAENSEDADE